MWYVPPQDPNCGGVPSMNGYGLPPAYPPPQLLPFTPADLLSNNVNNINNNTSLNNVNQMNQMGAFGLTAPPQLPFFNSPSPYPYNTLPPTSYPNNYNTNINVNTNSNSNSNFNSLQYNGNYNNNSPMGYASPSLPPYQQVGMGYQGQGMGNGGYGGGVPPGYQGQGMGNGGYGGGVPPGYVPPQPGKEGYFSASSGVIIVPPSSSTNISPPPSSGQKRALLIGINYLREARAQLKGCINDVHTVNSFLRSKGFQNIHILTDDQNDPSHQPTKENILREIRWLVGGASPGDSLFFHFSGHGGQVKDLNGDEEDGLDETILPVDFAKAGQIIDDDLHDMLVKSLPAGCKLTALMDCCHSGTGLDLPYVYSLNSSFSGIISTSLTSKIKSKAKKKFLKTISNVFGGGVGGSWSGGDCILFSGCRDDQTSADTNFDGKPQGAMTYSLTKALQRNPNQSYLDVLKNMRAILSEHNFSQVPQLSSKRQIDMNQPFAL